MQKYKILVLKNGKNINIEDEIKHATEFMNRKLAPILEVEFTIQEVDIKAEYQIYKQKVKGFSSDTGEPMLIDYYGLKESIGDKIRSIVAPGKFNNVMIVNDISEIPVIAGISYPNFTLQRPIHFNTGYIQIVYSQYLKDNGSVKKALPHEILHDFCYTLNRYGYPVLDEMDIDHQGRPFYNNDYPEQEDSNFGFTFKNIKPYLDKLVPKNTGPRVLKIKMEGSDVAELQTNLKKLGFNAGTIDGKFGLRTDTALRMFQQAYKLTKDGIAGPITIEAIDRALTPKKALE